MSEKKRGVRAMVYRKCEKWIEKGNFVYDVDLLVFMSSYEILQELEEEHKQKD